MSPFRYKHNLPLYSEVLGPLYLGIAAVREGRYQEADSLLERGLELWGLIGAEIVVPYLKRARSGARGLGRHRWCVPVDRRSD